MHYKEVYKARKRRPFQPIKIRLKTGPCYEVRHPDFLGVLRTSVLIGIANDGGDIPETFDQVPLREVAGIEPL